MTHMHQHGTPATHPREDQMSEIDIREVVARAVVPAEGLEPVDYQYQLADKVIRALTAAGIQTMAPQDLSWGSCPGNPGEPHQVSLSLCSGCLEYDPE